MPGQAERRTRLMAVASELAEPPAVMAYYAVPPGRAAWGPGWYMGPDLHELTYIGYSAAAAEVRLIEMVRDEARAEA